MKLLGTFVAAILVGFAHGQTTPPEDLPSTPAPQTPAIAPLPAPQQANGIAPLRILSATEQSLNGDVLEATGDVVVTYKGYTLHAQHLIGNRKTQIFTLTKDARLVGADTTIAADRITIDFRSKEYSYENGEAILPPSKLEGRVTGPLYVSGAKGAGTTSNDKSFTCTVTTCDQDKPHYHFDAKDSEVVADRYVKLHDVKFKLFGKTLFSIPYLYLPLKEDATRLVPEVGQTEDEGFYVKAKYFTPVKANDLLIARVDYLQKLGQGFGADYKYATERASGVVSAYGLIGVSRTFSSNVNHQQRIGRATLGLDGTYQRNNYLTAPDSVFLSTRASYQTPGLGGNVRLSFQRSSSESAGFQSSNQTVGLNHQISDRRSGYSSSLDLNLAGNKSAQLESERLDLRLKAARDDRTVLSEFQYQRLIPVKGSNSFSGSSDITPQFALATDLGRLTKGKVGAEKLGVRLELGELGASDSERITRTHFQANSRVDQQDGRLSFGTSGKFLQGLYSDDTAQYVLGYDGKLEYAYGGRSSFGVNYARQRQFGYTPLATDFSGRNDTMNLDWIHAPDENARFTVGTSYDFEQASTQGTPWQSVNVTGQYQTSATNRLLFSSYYDTFSQVWSSSRLEGQWKWGSSEWAAGVRYDGSRAQWAGANLQVRGFRSGKITTDAFFGYNGYTQQMEAQQFRFAYNLHCWEAVLEITDTKVGFRPGRTIGLFVRVKALPFTDNFGVGSRGQNYFSTGGTGY